MRLTNLLVWGVDLVEEHLLTCAGIPSRPPVAGRPLVHVAEYSVNAHKSGVILNTDYIKVGHSCHFCRPYIVSILIFRMLFSPFSRLKLYSNSAV